MKRLLEQLLTFIGFGPSPCSGLACIARQQEAEWKLADYLRAGGMLSEPADDGDVWEAGRNIGMAYCVDGQGRTILECAESISDHVMQEISSPNVRAQTGEALSVAPCSAVVCPLNPVESND